MDIDSVAYVGATEDGENLALGLADALGVEHELTIHYSKMSRLMSAVLTCGQVAARNRTKKTPLGADMPDLQNLMIVSNFDAQALPDGNVAVRLLIQDVPMDLRLSPEIASALASKLQAVLEQTPRSALPPTAH